MSELKIRTFPDSELRKKAAKIATVSEVERKILSDMARTMYLNSGVGLAAVQLGIDKQLAVVDIGEGLLKFINPTIVKKEGSEVEEEGCLSVPGIYVKIKRAKKIEVTFLNEDGTISQLCATGLLARAIQHEIDHLSGKLIIDHLNPVKRMFLKKGLTKS